MTKKGSQPRFILQHTGNSRPPKSESGWLPLGEYATDRAALRAIQIASRKDPIGIWSDYYRIIDRETGQDVTYETIDRFYQEALAIMGLKKG